MVKWEAGRRVELAKEGKIVGRAARGIPIDSQTLSQICSQRDTPVCDGYVSSAILRVLILQVPLGVVHSRSCLVRSGDIRG
jgi:hypothetical protein